MAGIGFAGEPPCGIVEMEMRGTSQRRKVHWMKVRRGEGRNSFLIDDLEDFLRVGLVCALLLLGFLALPCYGQDQPPELAFARKLYADGLYLLAAEQYGDFAQAHPNSPLAAQARFMVGESFFAQGDLAQAKEAYRKILAEHPQGSFAPQAWFRLGTCLGHVGHFADAAAAFIRSREMEPEGPWASSALFGLADALYKGGELSRALEEFDDFVEQYPQSPQAYQAHMARAEILAGLDRWSSARGAYQAAAQQADSPEDLAKARYREGQGLAIHGDEHSALDVLLLLVEGEPSSVYGDSALSLLGQLHQDRGEYRKAAEAYGALASGMGANELREWAGFREAESLRLATDHRAAVSAYRRWSIRYPNSQMTPEAKLGLSESLWALGETDSAAAVLEELTREAGEAEWGARAWRKLGDAQYQGGKPGRALDAYREFLRRYPQSPQADSLYFRTAQILEVDLNRPQAAVRTYGAFSSLYPQSPFADDADFAVGRSYEASEEYGQALEAYLLFTQEHPLSPLYPQAQEKAAHLRTYRVPDERRALQELVYIQDQLASGSLSTEDVDLRLGEIYFRHLKDFSRAAAALERFIQKHPHSPLLDQALFQLGQCHRARSEKLEIEGNYAAAAQAKSAATEACRRLLRDHPQTDLADQCALQVISDLLADDTSQGDNLWLDQLDLYASFLNTYGQSHWRGHAYLQMVKAYQGLAAQDQRFLAKADSVLAIILDQYGHSPWADTAAWWRIDISQRRQDETASYQLCQDFLEEFPQSQLQSQVLFIKAKIHARAGEHLAAAELFRSVAEDFPYHVLTEEAGLRRAESLWAGGDAQGARRALEEFGERYPGSPLQIRALILLAQDLVERGKTPEAQSLLSSLEDISSQPALEDEMQLALGDVYLKTGSLTKALGSYELVVRDFPDSPLVGTALERMADAYLGNENFSQAESYYERAMEQEADEDRKLYLLSKGIVCLYRSGRLSEAIEAREKFNKDHPDKTDLWTELLVEEGRAYEGRGEEKAAGKSFQAVLELDQEGHYAEEATYRLGLMALRSGEFSQALDRFRSLLEKHPQSSLKNQVLFKMGSALYALERYDRAAEHYELVAAQATEAQLVADALFNAGICRGKMNDWDGAVAAYERLVTEFPEHEEGQKWALRLGFAYLQAGRSSLALRTFLQIDAQGDAELGAEVQFWLGECYFHMGEYEKAAQEYLRVDYLYPHQIQWATTAEYNAGVSYEKLGRVEEARSIYRKLVNTRGAQDQWGAMAQERLDKLRE
jgi:TolA-binding protein